MIHNNILITGSGGFLGSILLKSLKNDKNNVIGLGRKNQDINIDISTPFIFDKYRNFDIIIHAAGKAHTIPNSLEEQNEFIKINFEGTKNLCKAIDDLNIPPVSFIFISTVAVYGLDEGVDIDENYPLLGKSPYAKSKIEAESYLTQWANLNNITLTILRLPLIAGPNPPGNLGSMIEGIKTGRYASIGKANSRKSMIWVEDIPQFILKIKDKGGVFNLTDNYDPTFGELELLISKNLGKSKPLNIPLTLAKVIAFFGDFLGGKFPVNSDKLNKITSTLTFSTQKAILSSDWKPTQVLEKL